MSIQCHKGGRGTILKFRKWLFSPLCHALDDLQGALCASKKQNSAFNFSFFFFLLAQISEPLPLPHHLKWSKLWLTNSINILTVTHLGDEEAAADFCSRWALPVLEELRVISR